MCVFTVHIGVVTHMHAVSAICESLRFILMVILDAFILLVQCPGPIGGVILLHRKRGKKEDRVRERKEDWESLYLL